MLVAYKKLHSQHQYVQESPKMVGLALDYSISGREEDDSHADIFRTQMRHPVIIAEEHMEHVPSCNETWQ